MVFAHHVDEVGNDDAAQVAQSQLACNGLRGLQVGFKNGVVEVARTDKTTGVDVHRGQGFGLVHHQVAARLQIHSTPERLGNFFIDGKQVEDRPLAFVQLQFGHGCGHELLAKGLQHVELLTRVDTDGAGFFTDQVAQYTLQQVQVLVQQRHGRQAHRCVLDAFPGLAQVGNVFGQLGITRVFPVGAQNEATTATGGLVTHQVLQPCAQGITLGNRDLLGHTHMVVLRQKNQ